MKSRKVVFKKIIWISWTIILIGSSLIYFGAVDWLFRNDGVLNPSREYQGVYHSEYDSNKPFFQWWYFTIKDLENNVYFTCHYNLVYCSQNKSNEGVYISFSCVDDLNNQQWHKYELYPLNNFIEIQDYEYKIENNSEILFFLNETASDTYTIYGEMKNFQYTWNSINCSDDTYIQWNLTLYRIYGWYGQADCAWIYKSQGIINWNPYAHDCEVKGTIRINSTEYNFERTSQYRAYADMNWGENFPSGFPSIEHPWGWYYVGLPNEDLNLELSIIAGIGFHDAGFPFGTCQGQFADIRLNNSIHIGLRQNEIWGQVSFSLMETSNDGDTILFNVERDNWTVFTDEIGSALIPLKQIVKMESYHYVIVMEFNSELTDYNRLLFPHEKYIFSDFEALGVNVHVTIKEREVRFHFWDILHLFPIFFNEHVILEFQSDDGGLEYGYNLN